MGATLNSIMSVGLPAALALIMFALGLGIAVRDFTRLVRQPLPVGIGLANQLVVLPAWACALVLVYNGRPEFAFGLLVIAVCPGGITSNLLTVLANGNAALSVSMTALSSLAGLATIPLILGVAQPLLLDATDPVVVPATKILVSVVLLMGVPVGLGVAVNHLAPGIAATARGPMRRLAVALFVLIVVASFVGQGATIIAYLVELGPYVLALNVGTMVFGLLSARAFGLSHADGVAITVEGGLQNAALAIFLAVSVFGDPLVVVPAIMYALMMNLSVAAVIVWARRHREFNTAVG